MKKVLLVLLLVISFGFFGIQLMAEDAETGNLVIHFKAWDEDYTDLGSWAWGGPAAGKVYDGIDVFGAYWEYNDIPVGTSVGFIAVEWPGGAGPNWDNKLTGDVNIDESAIVAGETTHVYVFEGAATSDDNPGHYIAKHDKKNLLVVYYDPAGAYEANVGVHAWGWVGVTASYNTPLPFTVAGKTAASIDMKASIFAEESGGGLLIYAGEDANKKSSNIEMSQFPDAVVGEASIAYVVSKGNAYLTGDNIYKDDYATFAEEAFSFKLMGFDLEKMSGTYAPDPYTVIVKTSAPVASPYATADDKDAARAEIEGWFTIVEKGTTNELSILRVDFATSNPTLNAFAIALENPLDNTKEYEVLFDLGYPEETLAVAKNVAVTINVKVPANTPDDAVLSIAGDVTDNGWTPGKEGFTATRVGTSDMFEVTFNVSVTEAYTTFEYKWTRGDWANEEFIATNRPLVVPNNVSSITIEDEIEAWADIKPPVDKYAAPVRVPVLNKSASIDLAMDTDAPEIIFISPVGIVGKEAGQRIIEVAWRQPFNQNSFPRFRATDDRDGDLTPFIFVPKGPNSILDTRYEGDYVIMLQVSDAWGNVTQETFIFRVVKQG